MAALPSQPVTREWTMPARGLVAAYLLGILLSLFQSSNPIDPRQWTPFAGLCALSFLAAWLIRWSNGGWHVPK